MERRKFLASSISSVLAAVGFGTAATADDDCQPEMHGGETVAPETCDQCVKLAAFQQRVKEENVINDQYHRDRLEALVDPKNHTWEGDCLYTETTPVVNETVKRDYSKEDVREMDYDINVSHTPSIVDVTVTINPPMPLRVIESTVTVGDVDG